MSHKSFFLTAARTLFSSHQPLPSSHILNSCVCFYVRAVFLGTHTFFFNFLFASFSFILFFFICHVHD